MASIILFIADTPVGYRISLSGKRYYFEPALYCNHPVEPPHFCAFKDEGQWQFEGLEDWAIKDQIINLPLALIENMDEIGITAAP